MSIFLTIMLYLAVSVFAIIEIGDAGRYFIEKKYGRFGISTYLAIYWMAWVICHSFS